jgi:N utilization substance protein A
MNDDMMEALRALATEKGITPETLMGALADALESAYKRLPNAYEYAWATIDPITGEMRVTAQELDEDGNPHGPELDVTPDKDTLGRIAAQTFKQVMMQRLREAEREMKYEEYAGREGDIVTGIIQQTDARYTLLDLGRVEALLPQAEQVPYERPEPNSRLKAYIVEVRKTAKGPQIVVSRTHPGLIKRLFELEVPEIADGIVEIKACAREPGHRTKIAVWSNDHNVDPVGACVGARGARVRMVVNELRGEKIDIVPFSEDLPDFVAKALSAGQGQGGPDPRGHRHRRGDRARLPAVAGHRQGGPERPPRRPPHRLARRHQERDPAGRGRGLPDRRVGPGRVGPGPRHRGPGVGPRRRRRGRVGRGVGPRRPR